ncbi:hypothetical protein D9M68_542370 [compost metagenome]
MVDGLDLEQGAISAHRKRRGTYIAAARQGIAGGTAAAFGQAVAHGQASGLAQYLDTAILAQEGEDFLQHRPG